MYNEFCTGSIIVDGKSVIVVEWQARRRRGLK